MSSQRLETVSSLTEVGVEHTIKDTAPSITATNGHTTGLQELDASKITFTYNANPNPVPEPNSAEVTRMSRYVGEVPSFYNMISPTGTL